MHKYIGSLRSEFDSLQKKQELLFTKAQEEGIIIDNEIDTIKKNIDDLVNMGIKIPTKTHQQILDEIVYNLENKKVILNNRNDFEELQKKELYEKDFEEANFMNTEIMNIKENIDYLIFKGVNISTKTYQEIFDEITFSLENKDLIGDENEIGIMDDNIDDIKEDEIVVSVDGLRYLISIFLNSVKA